MWCFDTTKTNVRDVDGSEVRLKIRGQREGGTRSRVEFNFLRVNGTLTTTCVSLFFTIFLIVTVVFTYIVFFSYLRQKVNIEDFYFWVTGG